MILGRLFAKIFSRSAVCWAVRPSVCAMRGLFHHLPSCAYADAVSSSAGEDDEVSSQPSREPASTLEVSARGEERRLAEQIVVRLIGRRELGCGRGRDPGVGAAAMLGAGRFDGRRRTQEERGRDRHGPAQRVDAAAPGRRRFVSRGWRPRRRAIRLRSAARSLRRLPRRARGPRPSSPGARGCTSGRPRGASEAPPVRPMRGRRGQKLRVRQMPFGFRASVVMAASLFYVGNPTAARESSGRPGTDVT